MAKSALIQARVNPALKTQADSLFHNIGIDTASAIRIFLTQAVASDGFPFAIQRVPNSETIAAMQESEKIAYDESVKGYSDVNQMFSELLDD